MWWWKRRIHPSWLLAVAGSGFVMGVAAALWWYVPFAWGVAATIVLAGCFFVRTVYVLPIILCTAGVCGVGYGSAYMVARGDSALFAGTTVQVRGKVKEDASRTATGSTSLQLTDVAINGIPVKGFVLVSVRSVRDVKRGDIIQATGKAKDGFANFIISVSVTKLDSVTRLVPGDIGRVARDWFADRVRSVIPEPQASLGVGFLTGQKSSLPTDLADAMKIAGLTHIVVASGYNLTILVRLARKLLLRLSKYLSLISSTVMVCAFMMVTGLSPSMTRAGLVSSLSLLSWYYGHAFHPFVLLPIAAAITVAFEPSYVWGDLGWQLSFSAFAGVMVVSPLLQAYFFGGKEPGVIRQILGETIAAHLVTVPIIALSFGTISNVAIIANLLVVPLVPLAMLLTFLCGLIAIVATPVAAIIAIPASWLLGYMVQVAKFVADIPWAQSQLGAPAIVWGIYAAVISAACWWMWRKSGYNFRNGELLY